ncbi:ABC-type amino acid transport substrate-binding protein [Paucibacter oligotrophus]|uniref:ABC-type amino acid transport substrate-binding protein n=1 Tax=Roseateles oligotrophus TaxID=1769250 RepID=A0A840LCW3_9BURK|nr:transporter substrate-binding domain-containing protein [Roseateles oligotrophus]MBB4845561.1 ABC-type amino acid transport substrate-binding protein [Roseateles oligotrophus]
MPSPTAANPARRRLLSLLGLVLADPSLAGSNPFTVLPIAINEQANQRFLQALLALLAAQLQVRWDLHSLPWARVLRGADEGRFLALGLSRDAERERRLAFSAPVFANHLWLVVRQGEEPLPRRLADLRGQSLCVPNQVHYGPALVQELARLEIQLQPGVGELEARVAMLQRGRCAGLLTSYRGASAASMRQRLNRLVPEANLLVLDEPVDISPVHIVAARNSEWAPWLGRIDRALAGLEVPLRALVDSEL